MGKSAGVGVYFMDCDFNNEPKVNFTEISNYVKNLDGVSLVKDLGKKPAISLDEIKNHIKNDKLQSIILAGYSPGLFKSAFLRVMRLEGIDLQNIKITNFKTYGAKLPEDLDKAKAILYCAVNNVLYEQAAEAPEMDVNENTLVIGGGIAGIQASLEIANAGYKVYLLEKTGTIGGHMAMFDKTFPTLDCAACILTPKMVEVGQHPNIEIITYSQLKDIQGKPGNFEATILKKARRVNLSTCIGCDICAQVCPTRVPSEFDANISLRKAAYIPFPQAVPNKYLIDEANCIYVKNGKCGVCAKQCPANAINLDEKDEEVKINVGNIIVATGFKPFDAKKIERFGYGKYPNVINSLEFERLVNASGPTGGALKLKSKDKKGRYIYSKDGENPSRIAIIHCVGSRDENFNKYCSRVCCMYSLKFAHLVKEKLHDADVCEYYIDIRAFGKGYEEFYQRIKAEGVKLIRGKTAKIDEKNEKLLLRTEDILNDKLEEKEFDMVVLALGLEAGEDAAFIAEKTGLSRGEEGWFTSKNVNTAPSETAKGGIFIAGLCQGPKDIPDTVAQASAAASQVLQSLLIKKIKGDNKDISLQAVEAKVKQLVESK